MLKVENLFLQKGDFSLKKLSFAVEKNSYFVILGKTGSGKTMLLESLAGINQINGKIFFGEEDITHLPPEKRGFGFVYQDFVLFPNLTVKENIVFASRYKQILDVDTLFADIINFLQIEHILERKTTHLSGGEKQRVAMARAIYSRPKLLLLDEPLSAVDPTFRNAIMKSLKEIVKRYDTTIIHVTHNFREASYLADNIAVMMDGSILEQGEANSILNHPKSIEVAQFLGFKNIFPSSLIHQKAEAEVFSIDPSAILFSHTSSASEYCFKCTIEDIMGISDHYKVFARVKEHLFFAKVPKHMFEKLDLKEGIKCFLCIKKKDIVFI
ncbi:MAG: sulfate ABC transporter ATP-binding protein [Sulfurovum sp.]|nr:MAG: sulfate ABC transporter ATP-binding protein [Sulfurovum sp.]